MLLLNNYLNKFLLVCMLLVSVGCVAKSVHPFYKQEKLVDISAFFDGQWKEQMRTDKGLEDTTFKWTIQNNLVTVHISEKQFMEIYYAAFEVGDDVLIDMHVVEDEWAYPHHFWYEMTVSVHTLWKLLRDGERYVLVPLNEDWVKKQVEAGKADLPFAGDLPPVFTATSEQWMEFLEANIKSDEAFDTSGLDVIWLERIPMTAEKEVESEVKEVPVEEESPSAP